MKKVLFGLILSFVMVACTEKSSDCGDPESTNCELVLMDTQNHFLVGAVYNQDSIRLQVGAHQINLNFDNGTIIFNFAGLDSVNSSDYILKLNNEDYDTLNLTIHKYVNACWSGYRLDSLSYNNKIMVNITANRFEITK